MDRTGRKINIRFSSRKKNSYLNINAICINQQQQILYLTTWTMDPYIVPKEDKQLKDQSKLRHFPDSNDCTVQSKHLNHRFKKTIWTCNSSCVSLSVSLTVSPVTLTLMSRSSHKVDLLHRTYLSILIKFKNNFSKQLLHFHCANLQCMNSL